MNNRGISSTQLAVIIGLIVLLFIILLPAIAKLGKASERATCASNLKQWHQAFQLFADEHPEGKYPPAQASASGSLTRVKLAPAPDIAALYPDYFKDPTILYCPADPRIGPANFSNDAGEWDVYGNRWQAGDSYNYIGYALDQCDDGDPTQSLAEIVTLLSFAGLEAPAHLNDIEPPAQIVRATLAMLREAMKAMNSGLPAEDAIEQLVDLDLAVGADFQGNKLGTGQSDTVFRLRKDLQAFAEANGAADASRLEQEVFVMFDRLWPRPELYNHKPGGSNVLFLDGHVEFIRYPGKAPLAQGTASLLTLIDAF